MALALDALVIIAPAEIPALLHKKSRREAVSFLVGLGADKPSTFVVANVVKAATRSAFFAEEFTILGIINVA